MSLLKKASNLFSKKKQNTTIPPEIQALIPQVRAENPQVANLSDEAVAELIEQSMQKRGGRGMGKIWKACQPKN